MAVEINSQTGKGALCIDITGDAAIGSQGGILNPEGADLLITDAFLYIVTPATAAATFNIGIGATAATDASDIMSAFDMNAPSAGTAWNAVARTAASEAALTTPAIWTSAKYLTFTSAAASAAGLEAKLYVKYIRLA